MSVLDEKLVSARAYTTVYFNLRDTMWLLVVFVFHASMANLQDFTEGGSYLDLGLSLLFFAYMATLIVRLWGTRKNAKVMKDTIKYIKSHER